MTVRGGSGGSGGTGRADPAGAGSPGGALPGAALAARPAPPRWRDRRLVAGVLVVLGCALLGSRLLAAADARVLVWSAARDLAAGATVEEGDLVAVPAAAPDLSAYVAAASGDPVGTVLGRDLAAGELLAVAGVRAGAPGAPRRLVTVPVEPLHAPPGLEHGERVDVWVTPREDGAATPEPAALALEGALVAQVDPGDDGYGAGDAIAVVLDVEAGEAQRLVAASRQGSVDLVRVPLGQPS